MSKLKLTKFEVAERQLLLAINLFMQESDPISIHTLVEAASQVLYDIGSKYGASSFLRDSDKIKEEYKQEWLYHLSKSKNYFKHADRDPDDIHEFNTVSNDFSLLDAINMYETIKKQWVPETIAFYIWFGVEYPQMLKAGTDFAAIFREGQANGTLPKEPDKRKMATLITMIRNGEIVLENVSIDLGL